MRNERRINFPQSIGSIAPIAPLEPEERGDATWHGPCRCGGPALDAGSAAECARPDPASIAIPGRGGVETSIPAGGDQNLSSWQAVTIVPLALSRGQVRVRGIRGGA